MAADTLAIRLEEALTAAGVRVLGRTPDAPTAIRQVGQRRPDLLIVDSGVDFGGASRLMRWAAGFATPPALILMAAEDAIENEILAEFRPAAFLPRALEPDAIKRAIDQAVSQLGLGRPAPIPRSRALQLQGLALVCTVVAVTGAFLSPGGLSSLINTGAAVAALFALISVACLLECRRPAWASGQLALVALITVLPTLR